MPSHPDISFGTDGWRAIIADEYTFDNVRACAAAVATHLHKTECASAGVAIGFDTRFLSEEFALAAAKVFANQNIEVVISDRPLPTPALSYAVTTHKAAAGIMITASHNPPDYNGFKVKSSAGGSAPPDQVAQIEAQFDEAFDIESKSTAKGAAIRTVDMVNQYRAQLARVVDIERIRSAGIALAVDSMHGSGANVLASMIEETLEIRGDVNPAFPGMNQPEPTEENLRPLIELMTSGKCDVGVATDGDADRLGVVDENGVYLSSLEVFSMLFQHIKSRRKTSGGAACGITMSNMMDRLTEHHGTDLYRTPVGFKFISPAMIDNGCALGGEESGGYAFAGHIPERDGPMSALMFLESMAISGKSPSELLREVHEITGPHTYRRIDQRVEPLRKSSIQTAIDGDPPSSLDGNQVVETDRRDGLRLVLGNGAWAVARMSGTEPLIRLYAEAATEASRDNILADLQAHLGI